MQSSIISPYCNMDSSGLWASDFSFKPRYVQVFLQIWWQLGAFAFIWNRQPPVKFSCDTKGKLWVLVLEYTTSFWLSPFGFSDALKSLISSKWTVFTKVILSHYLIRLFYSILCRIMQIYTLSMLQTIGSFLCCVMTWTRNSMQHWAYLLS